MNALKSLYQVLIRSILLLSFILFVLPVAAQKQYEVTATKLNVRSEAKSNGTVVGSVTKGEVLTVNNITGSWAEIKYKGRKGYVSSQYLKAKSTPQRETTSHTSSPARSEGSSHQHNTTYSSSSYSSSSASALSRDSGLGMTADIGLGYKSKVFSTTFTYDVGYQLKHMLYFGAGPTLEADFSDGGSFFSAGGQAKVLFVAPLKGNVAPMIDARIGYLYNFSAKSGGLFYGGDLGICIKQHYAVGIRANITSHIETYKEKKDSYYKDPKTGKWYPKTIKVDRERTVYDFVPFLFFTYLF